MSESTLNNACRFCLKEGFTMFNIFLHHSPAGDLLYEVLNYVYELKLCEGDDLPSVICAPCMWRMIEFEAYKKNVIQSEVELKRMKSKIKPATQENNIIVGNNGANVVASENVRNPVDDPLAVENTTDSYHSMVLIKEEFMVENIQEDQEGPSIGKRGDSEETGEDLLRSQSVPSEITTSHGMELKYEELDLEDEDMNDVLSSPETPFDNEQQPLADGGRIVDNLRATEDNFIVNIMDDEESQDDSIPSLHNFKESNSNEQVSHGAQNTSSGIYIVCHVCDRRFTQKRHLDQHIKIHSDEKPYSCSVCNKRFKQQCVKYRHELRHLRDNISKEDGIKRLHKCEICGKSYKHKKTLNQHSNVHSDKFSCVHCGRNFDCASALSLHLSNHSNERPFSCGLCDKSFKTRRNLNKHVRNHTDERPFSCDICNKRFKKKAFKDAHELIHLKEKASGVLV